MRLLQRAFAVLPRNYVTLGYHGLCTRQFPSHSLITLLIYFLFISYIYIYIFSYIYSRQPLYDMCDMTPTSHSLITILIYLSISLSSHTYIFFYISFWVVMSSALPYDMCDTTPTKIFILFWSHIHIYALI